MDAGQDERIAAVIGQCGAFDHKADSKLYLDDVGMGYFLKLFVHGQRDKGRSRFGLSPHKYPAYGKPGSIAMLAREGAMEGIARLAKKSTTFVNETCARLALMPHAKDPLESAKNVNCPVLLLVCEQDNLVSPESHKKLAEILGHEVEVISFPYKLESMEFEHIAGTCTKNLKATYSIRCLCRIMGFCHIVEE